MVKRCAWGTCNSDERYPKRIENVFFIPFPKPKTQLEKCLRWIRACSRPHDQLNTKLINKHKYVCSKHFVNGSGPSEEYPDPVAADGSTSTPCRPPPKKRLRFSTDVLQEHTASHNYCNERNDEDADDEKEPISRNIGTETDEPWITSQEVDELRRNVKDLEKQLEEKNKNIDNLQKEVLDKDKELSALHKRDRSFGVAGVLQRETKLKGLFKHYTGVLYVRFLALFAFLTQKGFTMDYGKGRADIRHVTPEDCLFLTLCRLRHNFALKDLGMRFGLSVQSSGIVFNAWIEHMYFRLGQLSIWPHRDTIIQNMPRTYKQDFPTSLVIIDGTEIRTQVPCALGLHSQMYSDYKSSSTLKCLIGCDPNGSVIFVSELFTGSISDKALTQQSGFYDVLSELIQKGHIKEGDAVMADKGFTIESELNAIGLKLNIPPFATAGKQMSTSDTKSTIKIAKHRIHIERLIAKVKKFKIVSQCIPTSLFHTINRIWSVSCHLTLFQDIFVTDKKKQ